MTDYHRKVWLFRMLTRKSSKGKWTRAHMDMLNNIAAKICNHMQLGLIDMSWRGCIHVGLKNVDTGTDVRVL